MLKLINDSKENREILGTFIKAGALLKGHFRLSSGLYSDTYLQCAKIFENTSLAGKLCEILTERVKKVMDINKIGTIIAPAMGGIIFGYEMSRHLAKENIFCERINGSFVLKRGFDILSGSNVIIAEDVITTGKSSLEVAELVRKLGAKVAGEVCLINRSGGQSGKNLDFPVISLLELDIVSFDRKDTPERLKAIEPSTPGSRFIS